MKNQSTIETETRGGSCAPVTGSAAVEREKREWWAVADDDVRRVTGYSCAPNNPDMWWCPSVGYSMSEKHHLFENERDAIDKLISELERKIVVATDNIEALRLRRQNAELCESAGREKASASGKTQCAPSDSQQ